MQSTRTPLYCAMLQSRVKVAKVFFSHPNIAVNHITRTGQSLLHVALLIGDSKIVALFLAQPKTVTAPTTKDGRTPLTL